MYSILSCSVMFRHVPSGAAPVDLDIQVIQSRSTRVDPRGALDTSPTREVLHTIWLNRGP